jgi:hypothetical protein
MNTKDKRSAVEQIMDAEVLLISVENASKLLGVACSTARYAIKTTGQITTGVPVIKIGGRYKVPTAEMRKCLGIKLQATQ